MFNAKPEAQATNDLPQKQKHAGGRPSKYDPSFCKQARKLARLGMTEEEMAAFFEVDVSNLERWKNRHPEFRGAIKEGREISDINVADKLYKKATGFYYTTERVTAKGDVVQVREYQIPDTASAIFWLKNRRRLNWKDKTDLDVNHKHSLSSEFEAFLSDMRAAKEQKMLEAHAVTVRLEHEHSSVSQETTGGHFSPEQD